MRILFAGTPEFAAGHLRYLLEQGFHEIVAVFTQPDRPAGRGKKMTASPVKELALSHHLPIYQPRSLRDNTVQEQIAQLTPDVIIVVAYGLILPENILTIPRFGCLNVHASLLPRWRGAAPIQRAIEAGDKQTGITIMQMDAGLDTGDMLLKVPCSIDTQDTAASLHDKLMALGCPALLTVLQNIDNGNVQWEKQNGRDACYAAKITKTEARLNWKLPAPTLQQKIRAFNAFPVAYFECDGLSIRVWEATVLNETSTKTPGTIVNCSHHGIDISTGAHILRLKQLQLPGKKILTAQELLNGYGNIFSIGKILH
jgi:methionyl-tRNA formyltransferase